ncbi:hypothetical protein IIC38_07965 [candidate division KSB1 bacterium]|nr:hypothetical protein [candidate division KSB1 bacterium]
MVGTALKTGFSNMWTNKRMLIVFYLSNLFFGMILMLPFRGALSNYIGNSKMGEILAGRLDMDFVLEFIQNIDSVMGLFGSLVPLVPILFWLFLIFLSGGAFAVFASGEKYTPVAFWGGCAQYFGRFIRLVLWSLLFGVLFFLLQLLVSLVRKLFGDDPYQNITYWLGWVTVGVRYISIILFGILLDYARIHAVTTGDRRMRVSVWYAFKFMFRNFVKTFSLALFLFVIGAMVLVIYNLISDSLSAPSALVILLLFVFQQLYMVFRMMMRLTFYSSQTNLFQSLSEDKITVTETSEGEIGIEGAPA